MVTAGKDRLSFMDDNSLVRFTVGAYGVLLSRIKSRYTRMKSPPPGSKLWSNALAFGTAALSNQVSIYELMLCSLNNYNESWCLRTFKTPYPPLTVITSEKAKDRALRQIPNIIGYRDAKRVAEALWPMLKRVDRATALELIDSDAFSGGNENVKTELRKLVEGE